MACLFPFLHIFILYYILGAMLYKVSMSKLSNFFKQ